MNVHSLSSPARMPKRLILDPPCRHQGFLQTLAVHGKARTRVTYHIVTTNGVAAILDARFITHLRTH